MERNSSAIYLNQMSEQPSVNRIPQSTSQLRFQQHQQQHPVYAAQITGNYSVMPITPAAHQVTVDSLPPANPLVAPSVETVIAPNLVAQSALATQEVKPTKGKRGRKSSLPPEQREQNRRLKKQNMERRRRACISEKMTALHNLALSLVGEDPALHQKIEKADILNMCFNVLQGVAEIVKEQPSVQEKVHQLGAIVRAYTNETPITMATADSGRSSVNIGKRNSDKATRQIDETTQSSAEEGDLIVDVDGFGESDFEDDLDDEVSNQAPLSSHFRQHVISTPLPITDQDKENKPPVLSRCVARASAFSPIIPPRRLTSPAIVTSQVAGFTSTPIISSSDNVYLSNQQHQTNLSKMPNLDFSQQKPILSGAVNNCTLGSSEYSSTGSTSSSCFSYPRVGGDDVIEAGMVATRFVGRRQSDLPRQRHFVSRWHNHHQHYSQQNQSALRQFSGGSSVCSSTPSQRPSGPNSLSLSSSSSTHSQLYPQVQQQHQHYHHQQQQQQQHFSVFNYNSSGSSGLGSSSAASTRQTDGNVALNEQTEAEGTEVGVWRPYL